MLELAKHILKTKAGKFDPAKFDDRYEEALAELVQAKINGKKIVPLRPPKPTKKNDLLEALRMSAGVKGEAPARRSASKAKPAKKSAASADKRAAPARRKAS
jgi:DNA end-binding protein Ku